MGTKSRPHSSANTAVVGDRSVITFIALQKLITSIALQESSIYHHQSASSMYHGSPSLSWGSILDIFNDGQINLLRENLLRCHARVQRGSGFCGPSHRLPFSILQQPQAKLPRPCLTFPYPDPHIPPPPPSFQDCEHRLHLALSFLHPGASC